MEIHGLWFDAALQAPAFGLQATDRRVVGYPAAGLALDASPRGMLSIFAETSAISLGRYGHYAGADAGVRVEPVRQFGLLASYRIILVNPKSDPDYVRLRVAEPFIGAALRF